MDVTLRDPGDRARLAELLRRERDAAQRDRYRAVVLALDGELTSEIKTKLGRGRTFVQRWVYAYRDGGLDAIKPGKAPGARPRLTPEQTERFRQRVLDGARAEDGVCTLRGLDFQRILREEFGVKYSLNGVYQLLHRLGFSSLSPRPKHKRTDFEAQEQFKLDTPLLWTSSDGKHKVYVYRSGSRTNSGQETRVVIRWWPSSRTRRGSTRSAPGPEKSAQRIAAFTCRSRGRPSSPRRPQS